MSAPEQNTGDGFDTVESVLEGYREHISQGMAALVQVMDVHLGLRSEESYVWDERGEKYLDCGGYGVFILGHRHPRVVEAVKNQVDTHPMATRILLIPGVARAAKALAEATPEGLQYVFFCNSGTEATELGLKLARLNGAQKIIATEGGFHGKTTGSLSVTGKAQYREPFEPLLPGVEFIPYGDAEALEAAMSGEEGAAFILEPVQGEAGVIIPYEGYLTDVQRICRENGGFLILDEIQTGLGRLGTWWGADAEGITPDVMLVGKGLSGGIVPVTAVVATPKAWERINLDPLLHTSTFGANPVAMAAAFATLETIRDEGIVERSKELGERILNEVSSLLNEVCPDHVAEVRGRGLLIGMEFAEDMFAGQFGFELLQRKIVVSTSLNSTTVLRLHPPAVMTDSDVDWLLEALRDSATSVKEGTAGPHF